MNADVKAALQEHQDVSKAVEQALTDTGVNLDGVATMLEDTAKKFQEAASNLRKVNIKSLHVQSKAIADSRKVTDHAIALLEIETAAKG